MKRLFVFSALTVVMSLWAVSCSKEQDIIENNPEKEVTSENPQAKEGTVLTFTVSTEYEETKTTWDGSDVLWEDNETVAILYGNDASDKATGTIDVDGETGDVTLSFYIPGSHTASETFYAVSPASASATLAEGSLTVTIPEAQDGSFASANIMAAKVEGGSGGISFKALSHVVKFSLSARNVYDRFYFTANKNSSVNIAGSVSTDFSTTEDALNYTTDPSGKYVDVSGLTTGFAQTYYFAVVPGVDLSKGIAFKAHKSGETADTWQVGSYSTADYGAVNRLKIKNIGTLDTQWIRTKWFIKTDEDGGKASDGGSWDKPGNATRLVNLLAPANVDPEPASWKLFGVDIYVASGTYNLQGAKGGVLQPNWGDNNITSIHGGYNATATSGIDINNQDVDSYPTNFVNNESNNNDRIFRFQSRNINNLTFDGITFTTKSGSNHNSRGQVMYIDGTSAGTINFNNCRFKDMVSSNAYGAPCFDFNASGVLNVNFEGCTFSGNQCTGNSTYGGAVLLESGENTTLKFTDCTFEANTSTGTKGGGALFVREGKVEVYGGSFANNTSATNGGAIYATGGTVLLSESDAGVLTCSNNGAGETTETTSTHYGGFLFSDGATIQMHRVVLDGNWANLAGDIWMTSGDVFINRSILKNTKAYSNSSSGWNAKVIQKNTKEGKLCIHNSIITNSSSPNVTSNGGLCVIRILGDDTTVNDTAFLICNTTIFDGGVKLVNVAAASLGAGWAINSIFRTTTESGKTGWGRTTQNIKTKKNNLTRPYSGESISALDTDYLQTSNLVMSWTDASNTLTWTLSNVTHTHTNKTDVGAWVSTNFSAFDTWLKTVETDPYGIFIDGTERTEYKPGA